MAQTRALQRSSDRRDGLEDLADLEGLAHPGRHPLVGHLGHLGGAAGDEHDAERVGGVAVATREGDGAAHVLLDGGDVEEGGVEPAGRERLRELAAVADATTSAPRAESAVSSRSTTASSSSTRRMRVPASGMGRLRVAPGPLGDSGGKSTRGPSAASDRQHHLRARLGRRWRRRRHAEGPKGAQRPGELEAGPVRGGVVAEREHAVVGAGQGRGVTEADAGAPHPRAQARVEERATPLHGDARPLVHDGEDHAALRDGSLHPHHGAERRHGDGVEQEVRDNLLEIQLK